MEDKANAEVLGGGEITFSNDGSEAYLCLITTDKTKSDYTVDDLKKRLQQAGVVNGIDEAELQKVIDDRMYNMPVKVAEDKKAVDGVDGWYEFLFQTEIDTKPKILEDGSVDYSEYGDVPTVEEGQTVVIYHPAIPSEDGVSVKGETIIAKKGKELARLSGRGFIYDTEKKEYRAKYDGKITYRDDKLQIEPELLIEGDVSFTTGDVTFQNDIHIRGNVLTGVKVISERGNIIVDGYVESATIKAKKDIVLKNGMQGNGKGYLEAGGDVTGKFFEQVQIKCKKDINANAIMNSDIECGQDVIVSGKYGIIIGGKVSATRYIHATIIGNVSEVKTTLCAGVDGDLFALLSKCEQDISEIGRELAKITNVLGQVQILIEKTGRSDLIEKKMALMRTKIEKDTKLSELTKKKQSIVEKMGKANLAKVTIEKIIYPGNVITINGVKAVVTEEEKHVEYARRGAGIIVYKIGE